ncbi:hypothetical protein BKP42_53010 [Rhodococcus erythropolis]|uniref:COG4315 family predicted lipoprotein n=1 Tax=Rhodococcus erythropolis TaxID=1833 RepID=UPI001556491C|nr:hypothetical protein [Rhodococcus erythropolis]PBI91882.1 hypothetical protein BKP42_53010 [Rhodococcus erythropolis]
MMERGKLGLTVIALALTLVLSGCADTSVRGLRIEMIEGPGEVLVDDQGMVLYIFEPDEAGDVATCSGTCARHWPPVAAAEARDLDLGSTVNPDLIGTGTSSDGAVLTYNHWPLYRYDADTQGVARGHNIDLHGGKWFAVTAAGVRAHTD